MRKLIFALFWFFPILLVTACETTSNPNDDRIAQAYELLKAAPDLEAPGVREQIAWLRTPGAPTINVAGLIYRGAHPDIIMEVADIRGPNKYYMDSQQRLYHDYIFNTPYTWGNAFQIAVAASRPELAERLAIGVAKQAGDYREGMPLGVIPSIAKLASQPAPKSTSHFSILSPEESSWSSFYHDIGTIQRINAQPKDTYTSPPGRGLLFRYAASMRPGWRYDTIRQFGTPSEEIYARLGGPATMVDATVQGDLADAYEKELTDRSFKTVSFILKNFPGDVNETLPFCMMRDGEPVIVCPNVSPTHLAARNTTMRDIVHKLEWRWLPAGKLKAFLAAGGDPNKKDSFGNTALAYARNGGVHPGANAPGDDFNITQLFAGAAIIAGAGALAGEGSYDTATEFMVGGLTDVINGTSDNITRMHDQADQQLQQQPASSATGAGSSNTSLNRTSEKYSFTCPATGRTHSVPISAASNACRNAMRRYAKAVSCNMIDDLEGAQNAYYSACASEM
ncbi:MAG: hypothetical protein CMM78_03905 [Rhodospirillaceae bacterium]|nr:hypothetical protein [Rhodospirillales bacterium]MAX47330.1 hypothetical protein [Rhodospirillaceae bacterium]